MSAQIVIIGAFFILLLLFGVWKRIYLHIRTVQAQQITHALLEEYLNLLPLFFHAYKQHIPKEYTYIEQEAGKLLLLIFYLEEDVYIDVLHLIDEMNALMRALEKKRSLMEKAQFQLLMQDFRAKHQQIQNAIYAVELHDFLRESKLIFPH